MPVIHQLIARDADSNLNPTMLKLLIALVVLFVVVCILVAGLLVLRAMKRSRKQKSFEPAVTSEKPRQSAYRRLTIETMNTTPAYAIQEKDPLVESPPHSPVPEIRITFPDEMDNKTGRPQSGRVVVVRMGDNNAIGLEPVDDNLPPYQKDERFQSLDLERMGGLKEKDLKQFS